MSDVSLFVLLAGQDCRSNQFGHTGPCHCTVVGRRCDSLSSFHNWNEEKWHKVSTVCGWLRFGLFPTPRVFSSIPRVVLTPAGPSFDLVLRRSQIAPEAIRKEALKQPRETANVSVRRCATCTHWVLTQQHKNIEKAQECYEQLVWRKDRPHSHATPGSRHDAGEESARAQESKERRRRRRQRMKEKTNAIATLFNRLPRECSTQCSR